MPNVKSLESITAKWAAVTPERAPYYEAGVKNPAKDWATNAKAGQSAYESAMRNPTTLALRATRIAAVGSEKWSRKAQAVGASRFREGVPAATNDFKTGFEPYHGVLTSLSLPERGARGDARNFARVSAVGNALHKKRVGT
jgi:hypothetical protein